MEILQNKFAFFENFASTIRETLPDNKQAEGYKAICEYGIFGVLPEDDTLKGMCLMAKASIFKKEKRGGNNNPDGKNQHKKEVKRGQSGQKGQSGQPFLETETETRNKELRNYGEFELVCLTQEKYEHYITVFGLEKLEYGIDKLDTWLTKQPKKQNQDHYGYFKKSSWVFDGYEDKQKEKETDYWLPEDF